MASPPKRSKMSEELILSVAKEASDIAIPWADVAPPFFVEWIKEFLCAHNVVKEMMFMAMLPSIAALLGARSSVKPSLQVKTSASIIGKKPSVQARSENPPFTRGESQ